jgi:charged multivesicular body protein 7
MQQEKAGGVSDMLYTVEGFRTAFGPILSTETLTDKDASILLKFLERDRKAIVFDGKVCSTIYFVLLNLSLQAGDQIYRRRDICSS